MVGKYSLYNLFSNETKDCVNKLFDDKISCLPQLLLLLYSPSLSYSVQVRLQIGIDGFDKLVGSYHVMCMV